MPDLPSAGSSPRKMRDLYGYNALIADDELAVANERYRYALERRDKLQDKIRFGSLALNGATLAAMLGIVGNAQETLRSLGVTSELVRQAIALLVIGMTLSGVSVWWSSICLVKWSAGEFSHAASARHRAALMEQVLSEAAETHFSEALTDRPPPPGFQYSKVDQLLTNAGGSCWAAAMLSLAWPLLRLVNWTCA